MDTVRRHEEMMASNAPFAKGNDAFAETEFLQLPVESNAEIKAPEEADEPQEGLRIV